MLILIFLSIFYFGDALRRGVISKGCPFWTGLWVVFHHFILTERFVLSDRQQNKRPQPLALFNCCVLLCRLDRPVPVFSVLIVWIPYPLVIRFKVLVVPVEEALAPMTGVVEEGVSLRVEYIPESLDFHGIVGMPVPAVVGAEGVSAFEPDALTHIVGLQGVINAGAPAVLGHPVEHRNGLSVVGTVVFELFADLYIVVRRGIGLLKVLDHRCEAGDVRHLDIGDSVYDRGGGNL